MSVRVQIKDSADEELAVLRFSEVPDVGEEIEIPKPSEGGEKKVYVVYKRDGVQHVQRWVQSTSGIMQGGKVYTIWVNPLAVRAFDG